MHLPAFEYIRAESVAHAVALLGEHGGRAVLLAGGTDQLIALRQRLASPAVVIGIGSMPELQRVEVDAGGGIVIGAGCRLSMLAGHTVLRARFPSLAAAIRSAGSRHVRNAATLGGNLNLATRCWYTNQGESWRLARPPCLKIGGEVCYVIRSARECFALNSVDSAPALMTLNARLSIAGPCGTRELAVAGFYRDDGMAPTTLGPAEILTAIHVPAHRDRTAFLKIAPRTGLDYGLGTIAAAITGSNRRVTSARLVVGSIASHPVPLAGAARLIEQDGLSAGTITAAAEAARADLDEITNLYSTAGYKRRLVRVLVHRALEEVRRQKLPVTEAA